MYLIIGAIVAILFSCACVFYEPLRKFLQDAMNEHYSPMENPIFAGFIAFMVLALCVVAWPVVFIVGTFSLLMHKLKNYKVED
jgi:hypothetical protein